MFFQQIVRSDIGCAAYLIGSTERGEAAVVDPRLDMVEEVLALAVGEGLRVRYVIETHNHADHVSGHHALAERTGATIATHALAGAAYPHRALQDGDEIALGEVRLRVIHTPGHRPEHIALAVIDDARGPDPWLVLSGDSLFVGDVARPDLAVDGREGAVALYHSLHDRLLALPDGTLVYPGHVSGSLCGRVTSRMSGTTIGFERRFNPALRIASVEEFVRYMNESLPQRPPNMARIVEVNRGAAPLAPAPARPIGTEEALRWRDDGAWLLDVRPVDAFAAGHLPGSIAVPLGGSQFQNRVGLALTAGRPMVLVASSEAEARRAIVALAVVGFDRVVGFVVAGAPGWAGQAALERLPEMSVQDLARDQALGQAWQVLDVREPSEWESGHIAGARHVPFYRVAEDLRWLDPERPVAVICGSGERSVIAASLLRALGLQRSASVRGGMDAWRAAGLPVERS